MVPKKSTSFINKIAIIAANGPIIPKLIIISLISKEIAVSNRGGLTIPISVAEKLAAIDEMARAATAFIEKCLKTVSWANIIPAKGAPNPADIAAATPLPIIISWGIFGINFCRLINEDTVAPKCTRGPYIPTEAPPLIDINEANVDPKPPFKSKIPALWCAA